MYKLALLITFSIAVAQAESPVVRPLIIRHIDETRSAPLRGNTHPLARPQFDQGPAPADLPIERMLLVLKRGAEQESALHALLARQQDPSSPEYHHWLTPDEFGQRFGVSDQDVQTITSWLETHGFQVARVSRGRITIEFSGTAGQVAQAFHTQIHKYVIDGEEHWANRSDPQIPDALAAAVAGFVSMHNFGVKSQLVRSPYSFQATHAANLTPQFTSASGAHALSPADYATIYGIAPAYQKGIDGSGTSIAVLGRTNIDLNDIADFRGRFGLPNNPPEIVVNGPDPGNLGGGEEGEAVLDTSWSGAVAPGAHVKLVVSASTNGTDGVFLSEEYVVDHNLADVMTESFSTCEAHATAALANALSSLAEQAAAQGITYLVSTGDSGAEGCDNPGTETSATGPISVNLLAATPYTVAVGGTMFEDQTRSSWWNPVNSSNGGSALSYIEESVWNEICTSQQCPAIWAGGGGASIFFSKPAWQAGIFNIPADGARDLPDVSLTAAGHDPYLICLRGSCNPALHPTTTSFAGAAGTSAAAPAFAGMMALVVQSTHSRQGQANYVLYKLAAGQDYVNCRSSFFNSFGPSHCVFNDIVAGSNAVLGESDSLYSAAVGYDQASGLGSVNAWNLIASWPAGASQLPQTRITIDRPAPQGSVLLGLAQLSGWAVDDTSSVVNVALAIDGVPLGNASYGQARPDVCSAYPGRAGCPNVGWSMLYDTSSIASGTHTLEVTATTADGRHYTVSSNFTVGNWTGANPIRIAIDSPGSNSASLSGSAGLGGWAIDDNGLIGQVSISIDGVPYGPAGYGGVRNDVCAVFPNRPNCPQVGWSFLLDTGLLSDGPHVLAVTATSQGGDNATMSTGFTVSNATNGPIAMAIDQPNGHDQSFSGIAHFGGWAIDSNALITGVSVSVDGGVPQAGQYGGVRADVCAAFPGRVGCPDVGWNVFLDTSHLLNGAHTLDVTVYDSTGQHATRSAPFVVANTVANSGLKAMIDMPGPQTSGLNGLATFSGWALADTDTVSGVQIQVDGDKPYSVPYGSSRPDVCNAYTGRPGCPNVGWNYLLDTTLLADGAHTLSLIVATSQGETLTVSTKFTVANWSTANPMKIAIDNPNSQTPALSGYVGLGGWALDDVAPVISMSVAIDGVPFGEANYGSARSDVCAVYTGRAGCPNVGWNFGLDTTLLADGAHTLAITATSAGWQRSTATSTFHVANSSGNPILIAIDKPIANGTLSGIALIGGWAINSSGSAAITSVQILVDGVLQSDAAYGGTRADVCGVYPSASNCPSVGWNALLDTTSLANGLHTLEVRAIAAPGRQATVATPIAVLNQQWH